MIDPLPYTYTTVYPESLLWSLKSAPQSDAEIIWHKATRQPFRVGFWLQGFVRFRFSELQLVAEPWSNETNILSSCCTSCCLARVRVLEIHHGSIAILHSASVLGMCGLEALRFGALGFMCRVWDFGLWVSGQGVLHF